MESIPQKTNGSVGKTLVVGVGEVGAALAAVLERKEPVLRLDVKPVEIRGTIDVMHLCIPYQSPEQFESSAISYIQRFAPSLTIINSTVVPGTTRRIARHTKRLLAYSPVRGKHVKMQEDLIKYSKFVAGVTEEAAAHAEDHFRRAGMKTRRVATPETLELAKLAETTYFGLCIAFAQELNRYAQRIGATYEEATEFFEEVKFLPRARYFPGFIGGHCVIPNIHLLSRVAPSSLLDAILDSNEQRSAEIRTLSGSSQGGEAREARKVYGPKVLDNR